MPRSAGPEGILIFSDPADDGFAKGDVYPHGPISSRVGHSARQCPVSLAGTRRSIDAVRPFDQGSEAASRSIAKVITAFPCVTATDWEKTTGLKRDDYFATIPCLPISYDTAHEILKVLAGANVPSGWQGGLPLAYHVGPGPAEVRLSVAMDYQIRTIWNVIATIPGTVEPDRWVMIGNHRDAWVYGAVDPGSGTAATLEMCRALGAAVKNGWKPRRTLVYASWDAEEYGLVGSTEWAEQHASIDQRKGRAHAQCRLGGQRAGVRGERRAVAARPRAGRRRRDHRPAHGQVAPRGLDRTAPRDLGGRRAAGPRRPGLGSATGLGRFAVAIRLGRHRRASFPRWARSARDPTSRRSSIIWRFRRSTSASREDMASITRSTTTSTGWRSSAIPSS